MIKTTPHIKVWIRHFSISFANPDFGSKDIYYEIIGESYQEENFNCEFKISKTKERSPNIQFISAKIFNNMDGVQKKGIS